MVKPVTEKNYVMARWFIISALLGIFLFSNDVSSAILGPLVSTKAGTFEGVKLRPVEEKQAVNAFLGIPYAEPPTGLLRFKKPKPFRFISGTYKATKKPPSCFQLDADMWVIWADQDSSMTEDCLFMNIWAPERRSESEGLKPVMVWFHGGGYTVGSSAIDLYDGQMISALGDVVVVTMNYRLNAFGFLDSMTDDAPGNMALYDQLLVLQWVQTNIEYFGGDPKKVTISGESAGAFTAGYLALSTLAHGLFHRVILQSGSSYALPTQNPSYGVENGNKLAKLVGCANETLSLISNPKEVVSCLRTVPATDLIETYFEVHDSRQTKINIIFSAQFWDELLPKHPIDIFQSKNYTAYDTLTGVTHDEGTSIFAYYLSDVYRAYTAGKLNISKALATEILDGLLKAFHFVNTEKMTDFYFKDVDDDQLTIIKTMCELIGDLPIVCPVTYLAEKYSERGANVQFYRFDHRPSTSPWSEWMGAAHFEEVQFVFGMPIRYPERYQDEEKALSEYMIRTWTNFVKSEPLTLKNGLPWPNYSRSNPDFATLQTDSQATGSGERKAQCEFWRPYFSAE